MRPWKRHGAQRMRFRCGWHGGNGAWRAIYGAQLLDGIKTLHGERLLGLAVPFWDCSCGFPPHLRAIRSVLFSGEIIFIVRATVLQRDNAAIK